MIMLGRDVTRGGHRRAGSTDIALSNLPGGPNPPDAHEASTRWAVERTLAWLHQNRRLRIRYERRPDIHQAFLTLGCIKICASALLAGFC